MFCILLLNLCMLFVNGWVFRYDEKFVCLLRFMNTCLEYFNLYCTADAVLLVAVTDFSTIVALSFL